MKRTKTDDKSGKKEPTPGRFVFTKLNYQLLIAGLIVMLIGFMMMIGGGSDNPEVWDPGVFSFRRITLGPVILLIGFVIEGGAIMYRPKPKKED